MSSYVPRGRGVFCDPGHYWQRIDFFEFEDILSPNDPLLLPRVLPLCHKNWEILPGRGGYKMVRLIRALGNQDGLNVLQLPPPLLMHLLHSTHPHWYMTSVRYRGQIMICGFDLMISLAHYYSRSGIWNLHKVSPRLEWIHYSGHVSFIITTGLTWQMTALQLSH